MILYRIKEIQVPSVTNSLMRKQLDFANTLYSWEFSACGWSIEMIFLSRAIAVLGKRGVANIFRR